MDRIRVLREGKENQGVVNGSGTLGRGVQLVSAPCEWAAPLAGWLLDVFNIRPTQGKEPWGAQDGSGLHWIDMGRGLAEPEGSPFLELQGPRRSHHVWPGLPGWWPR